MKPEEADTRRDGTVTAAVSDHVQLAEALL